MLQSLLKSEEEKLRNLNVFLIDSLCLKYNFLSFYLYLLNHIFHQSGQLIEKFSKYPLACRSVYTDPVQTMMNRRVHKDESESAKQTSLREVFYVLARPV